MWILPLMMILMHQAMAMPTLAYPCEEGAQEACLFFTLCETCKNFSVNFKEYVAYAAKELISGNTDYESLAPWAIKLV